MKFHVFGNFFRNLIGDLAWRWYLHRLGDTENTTLENQIKRLACQLDSVFELLPDRFYFEHHNLVIVKEASTGDCPICGLGSTYFSGPCRFPSSELQDRVKQAMAFKEELGATLPGRENLVIYSDSEETVDRITCPARLQWRFGRYKDGGQRGDSIVPVNSATLNNPTAARRVQGTHTSVPNSLETSLLVKEFLGKP
jgi:hypothetical protein